MRHLHRFAIRHPLWVVSAGFLVVLAIAPGISRLRLRTDGHALVPRDAPAVRLDHAVRLEFGLRDPLVVMIRSHDRDGIFNPRTLRLVADLTTALAHAPGLDSTDVRSLATEPSDHFRPGTLSFRRLLEPLPVTPSRLEELRGDVEAIGILTGTVVSFDHQATAIHLGTPVDGDRAALVAAIHQVIARADTAGHEISVIGAPVAESLLGSHILEDLGLSSRRLGGGASRFADVSEPGLDAIARLRLAIARHFGLLPLSIAVMALVFLIWFRSLVATLLPLLEAGACLVFVFGWMGWAGVPVYLTMAVLPVILVSMGLADEIHVFSCFRRHRAASPDAPITGVVRAAMDEMSLPVIATSMTTAVGFLSFAISPLAPVRAFGLFTAIGILFCMLWTLTVIPALLVLLAPRAFRARGRSNAVPEAPVLGAWHRIARLAVRRPTWTLAFALVGLALCSLGIGRVLVQDSWISGFARESAFYRATQAFNRQFYGVHRLLLVLDAGSVDLHGPIAVAEMSDHELRILDRPAIEMSMLPGCSLIVTRREQPEASADPPAAADAWVQPSSWTSIVESAERRDGRIVLTAPIVHGSALFVFNPAPTETLGLAIRSYRLSVPGVINAIDSLERFVRAQERYTVGGVVGPADHLATAEFLTNQRMPGFREIPSDQRQVSWLWNALRLVHGDLRMREVIDPNLRRCVVSVFLKDANYVDTGHLMKAIREHERTHLEPRRISLEFAGDVAVSQTLIEAIVGSQVRSLLASLLGILLVTAVIFRSLRWGALCMLPAALGVTATFAVMGWTGTPLGVATSMFAGMSLGVGVDFAIHLVERYRLSISRGVAPDAAILEAVGTTGPPIAINGMAVALGFGILVLSRVPANARLGVITVVSLVTCLAATLLVMPALLRVAGRNRADSARTE